MTRFLKASLSAHADDGWVRFCHRNYVNRSALAEAIGLELRRHTKKDRSELPEWLRSLVEEAGRVQNARSTRRPG